MKYTVVFDFDGVIHTGYKGYKDGSIYGDMDYQVLSFIKELMKRYHVVISSNRSAQQIVDYMNNLHTDLTFEAFNKTSSNLYWTKDDVVGVTNEKAIGVLYIDDRGYRYDSKRSFECINEIKSLLGVEESE